MIVAGIAISTLLSGGAFAQSTNQLTLDEAIKAHYTVVTGDSLLTSVQSSLLGRSAKGTSDLGETHEIPRNVLMNNYHLYPSTSTMNGKRTTVVRRQMGAAKNDQNDPQIYWFAYSPAIGSSPAGSQVSVGVNPNDLGKNAYSYLLQFPDGTTRSITVFVRPGQDVNEALKQALINAGYRVNSDGSVSGKNANGSWALIPNYTFGSVQNGFAQAFPNATGGGFTGFSQYNFPPANANIQTGTAIGPVTVLPSVQQGYQSASSGGGNFSSADAFKKHLIDTYGNFGGGGGGFETFQYSNTGQMPLTTFPWAGLSQDQILYILQNPNSNQSLYAELIGYLNQNANLTESQIRSQVGNGGGNSYPPFFSSLGFGNIPVSLGGAFRYPSNSNQGEFNSQYIPTGVIPANSNFRGLTYMPGPQYIPATASAIDPNNFGSYLIWVAQNPNQQLSTLPTMNSILAYLKSAGVKDADAPGLANYIFSALQSGKQIDPNGLKDFLAKFKKAGGNANASSSLAGLFSNLGRSTVVSPGVVPFVPTQTQTSISYSGSTGSVDAEPQIVDWGWQGKRLQVLGDNGEYIHLKLSDDGTEAIADDGRILWTLKNGKWTPTEAGAKVSDAGKTKAAEENTKLTNEILTKWGLKVYDSSTNKEKYNIVGSVLQNQIDGSDIQVAPLSNPVPASSEVLKAADDFFQKTVVKTVPNPN
ncbi:MAG: hypothetical protein JWQ35_2615 [Bacteriovoracaceae bacterium]|nr:hypothetical protein [Bacteriovoracaceae bacterium]